MEQIEVIEKMPLNLTHTKIYGHGAADILKQNEINAKLIDGNLNVILNNTQVLVIVPTLDHRGEPTLKFYLESVEPLY